MTEERKYETPEELVQPLLALVETALRLNCENHSVFVYYSGHIAKIDIDCYAGGWKKGNSATLRCGVYTDGQQDAEDMARLQRQLELHFANNESEIAKAIKAKEDAEIAEFKRLSKKFKPVAVEA